MVLRPNLLISTKGVTVEEVAKHNKKDDCWLIHEDNVYDLTGWVDKHPGGDVLLRYGI
jgi:cytochrome b involved in lipid metabolism